MAKDGATWALLLKILLVSLLRRFQPKAVTSFELLCLAVPLPDAMARWMVSGPIGWQPALMDHAKTKSVTVAHPACGRGAGCYSG